MARDFVATCVTCGRKRIVDLHSSNNNAAEDSTVQWRKEESSVLHLGIPRDHYAASAIVFIYPKLQKVAARQEG